MPRFFVLLLFAPGLLACGERAVSPPTPASATVLPADVDTVAHRLGHTLYVPVYSHIYSQNARSVINLTATLSIRNTDATQPIRISSVRYYDSDGNLVRTYVRDPVRLNPMASVDFVVDENDTSGGSGANFIVEWSSAQTVTEPVVEAVMISTASAMGISFTSPGRVLERIAP